MDFFDNLLSGLQKGSPEQRYYEDAQYKNNLITVTTNDSKTSSDDKQFKIRFK